MVYDERPAEAAERIRYLRERLGLTQIQFASLLGVTNVTVNRWERGRSRPNAATWQRIEQAESEGSAALVADPSAGLMTRRGNLPTPLTSFVGRTRELQQLRSCLSAARLVTLVGPGGCGKTRLAIELAKSVSAGYPDGVWMVDLAPLTFQPHVVRAVARALGVQEELEQPIVRRLGAALQDRRVLLVLDNCEHLREACAHLAVELLSQCPAIDVLATSRSALQVAGEQVWQVAPLSLPARGEADSHAAIKTSEAAKLFVERAQASHPSFALTDANAEAVAEICQRLDRLPLAIELAAARVSLLSAEQIADRLDDRFRLLQDHRVGLAPRQQALRATLDWSYDLLSEAERALFTRVSIFVGGFDFDAVEEMAGNRLGSMGQSTQRRVNTLRVWVRHLSSMCWEGLSHSRS